MGRHPRFAQRRDHGYRSLRPSTRTVSALLSRRSLAGALGLAAFVLSRLAEAKNKKKKPKFNDFGCVDVGKFCKNNGQCCSGICKGKKGKNLQKRKAHDQSTCQIGQQESACGGGTTVTCLIDGDEGNCNTTTGKAGYCANDGQCFDCKKDADCVPFCGPRAACILCAATCEGTGSGTACVGPLDTSCTFPMP